MAVVIREFSESDIPGMTAIWNTIVERGDSFPQTECMTPEEAVRFFGEQSFTAVALDKGDVAGLYILHPNNIGRCGHIANASYAVKPASRGAGIGEKLVIHSMETAMSLGFRILQFNAVTVTNSTALRLYERLGFHQMATIPGGFLSSDNGYIDIIPHYITLRK